MIQSADQLENIRRIVDEWRKGCSNGNPEDCPECTAAGMRAITATLGREPSSARPRVTLPERFSVSQSIDPIGGGLRYAKFSYPDEEWATIRVLQSAQSGEELIEVYDTHGQLWADGLVMSLSFSYGPTCNVEFEIQSVSRRSE